MSEESDRNNLEENPDERGLSAPSSDIDLPELTVEQETRFREELVDQLQMTQFTSWIGQLPHPRDMREYEDICPGSAQAIIDNMLLANKLVEKGIDNDRDSMNEFWRLKNREADLAEIESKSDRKTRDRATIGTFIYMFLLCCILVIVLLVDNDPWVKVTGLGAVALMLLAPAIINSLRGRHSDNEKAVIDGIPEIIRASKGAGDSSKGDNKDKDDKPLPPPTEQD